MRRFLAAAAAVLALSAQAPRAHAVSGPADAECRDPRCYVAITPWRTIQVRTLEEATGILAQDLAGAVAGQSGRILVKTCR